MSDATQVPRHGSRWGRASLLIITGLSLVFGMGLATVNTALGFEASLAIISSNGANNLNGFSFSSNRIEAVNAGFGMVPVQQACSLAMDTCKSVDVVPDGPSAMSVINGSYVNQGSATENLLMAVDGNSATKWYSGGSTTGGVIFITRLTQQTTVTKYSVTTANDTRNRDPKNWILEGSKNGVDWKSIDTVTNFNQATRGFKTEFTIANPGNYALYRWTVSAMYSGTEFQVADFALNGVAGVSSVASANPGSGTEAFRWAGDGNAGTKWYSGTFAANQTLTLTMTQPGGTLGVKATGYRVTAGGDAGSYGNRNPRTWLFQGSNDGSSWTTLHTPTAQTGWGNSEVRTFEVPLANRATYTQYRLVLQTIGTGQTTGDFQMADFMVATGGVATEVLERDAVWKNVLRAGFAEAKISGLCLSKTESVPLLGNYTIKLYSPSNSGSITAKNGVFDVTDLAGDASGAGINLKGNTQIGLATTDITTIYANGTGLPFKANPFGVNDDSGQSAALDVWDPEVYASGAPGTWPIDGKQHTFGGGWTGIDAGAADLYKVAGRLWQVQMTGSITLPDLDITVVPGETPCATWPTGAPYTNNQPWPTLTVP